MAVDPTRGWGLPADQAGPSSADRSLQTAANVRVQYRPDRARTDRCKRLRTCVSSTALSVPPFSIRGSRVVGRECAWRGAVPATASAASGDAPSRIARDETDQSVPNGLRLPSALNRFPSIVGTTIDSSIRRATKIVPGSPISDW